MEKFNITIIGAGVVGLAIAQKLSLQYDNILLIEKHDTFGKEASSRSSEVIHASIYYRLNSLKGRLCLRGNELIYKICKENNIPYNNSGKLVVSTNNFESEKLPKLLKRAQDNGAIGVRVIDESEISEIEPKVSAKAAMYCPTSGTVDSESLMRYYENSSLSNNVIILYKNEVTDLRKHNDSYKIVIKDKSCDELNLNSDIVINSSGLHCDSIAKMIGIDIVGSGYRINYHKGVYFRVIKKLEMFPRTLIYPLPPEPGSVGIHTTPDLAGGMRIGPHFIWADDINYSVDDNFHDLFYNSVKKYLPFIEYDDIQPDMSGIMASIQKPGELIWKDFIIEHEISKGFRGLINLIGMESPALTASPAIAEYVEEMIFNILK
jgi:L-2-hydroxyglutarate oxidase LhgO